MNTIPTVYYLFPQIQRLVMTFSYCAAFKKIMQYGILLNSFHHVLSMFVLQERYEINFEKSGLN